jgi:cytochrome c oxidase subunit 2
MDLVPGLVTYVWFTPTRTGKFDVLCEELCGIAHFTMRGKVVVEEESAFRAWLGSYPTFAQASARVAGDASAGEPLYAVCAACHGAQGEGNPALNAPKLSGQGDWYLKRQLQYFKSGARGAHEKDAFGKTMAPMAATLTDDAAIDNVVAYIKTLPDRPAPPTVTKHAGDGSTLYENCSACHGAAEGHERLVHGHAIEELPPGRPRCAREGPVRSADGVHGRDAARRPGNRRRRCLHQYAQVRRARIGRDVGMAERDQQ